MASEILKYHIVRDVAAGGAEVAPAPEMAAPVAFAQVGELHLHTMRGTALNATHEVADSDMRRYLDEHVDMLFGQNTRHDLYTKLLADLFDDRSDAFAQYSFQNLIAILGDPDDVIAMVKNGVTSGCVAHRLTP